MIEAIIFFIIFILFLTVPNLILESKVNKKYFELSDIIDRLKDRDPEKYLEFTNSIEYLTYRYIGNYSPSEIFSFLGTFTKLEHLKEINWVKDRVLAGTFMDDSERIHVSNIYYDSEE
jgi:hypothetical protein